MTSTAGLQRRSTSKAGGIGSEAVEKATGKGWDGWFRIIDRAGGAAMAHKDIAATLRDKHGLSGWWSQMVTVGYEQARKGRKKHEKPGGFEVSVSKTIGVPVTRLYKAWFDKRMRHRWLSDSDFAISASTKEKSMRITSVDGRTHVDVQFCRQGPGKSRVVAQHKKLTNAGAAERAKAQWRKRLGALKEYLESSWSEVE